MSDPIYRDDFLLVAPHGSTDYRVTVQVGNPPGDDRPTVVDGRELRDALNAYLEDSSETSGD